MKFLLAFDSFKGTLSSLEVCEIVKGEFLKRGGDGVDVEVLPLADGGDDTAAVLVENLGGQYIDVGDVYGPMEGMRVAGKYVELAGDHGALIEMALASGIKLVPRDALNPLAACSFGTGQILCQAMKHSYSTIYLTLGGSATVDGGASAAAAVGWQFLDGAGERVHPCGIRLLDIREVVRPEGMKNWPRIEALCDVENVLLGDDGASRIYGPQKGADAVMVEQLEDGLSHMAGLMKDQYGMDYADVKGAGAAGGFGFGAMAFFGAKLVKGTETILRWTEFSAKAKAADWVITGEGCVDGTSFQGKLISGVIEEGIEAGAQIGVLAGRVLCDDEQLKNAGVDLVGACAGEGVGDDEALGNARGLLEAAAGRLADEILGTVKS